MGGKKKGAEPTPGNQRSITSYFGLKVSCRQTSIATWCGGASVLRCFAPPQCAYKCHCCCFTVGPPLQGSSSKPEGSVRATPAAAGDVSGARTAMPAAGRVDGRDANCRCGGCCCWCCLPANM